MTHATCCKTPLRDKLHKSLPSVTPTLIYTANIFFLQGSVLKGTPYDWLLIVDRSLISQLKSQQVQIIKDNQGSTAL